MRRKETLFTAGLALTVLAVLLLVSLPLAYLPGAESPRAPDVTITAATTSPRHTLQALPPTPCASPYPSAVLNRTTLTNGTIISEARQPVLVMEPDSTLLVCTDYGSDTYTGRVSASISLWNTGGQPQSLVNISASPSAISVSPSQMEEVNFTLTSKQDSSGYYGVSLLGKCTAVPLLVAASAPTRVNASEFPYLFGAIHGCPPRGDLGRIVGYTGGSITWAVSTSRVNLILNITGSSVASYSTPQGSDNITLSVRLRTFSSPVTVGLSPYQSVLDAFNENPDLTAASSDLCSWYPSNAGATGSMTGTTFAQAQAQGSLGVDAPVLSLPAYSSIVYNFSLLARPSSRFLAAQLTLSVNGTRGELFSVGDYFPVVISGHVETVSGACQASSSG